MFFKYGKQKVAVIDLHDWSNAHDGVSAGRSSVGGQTVSFDGVDIRIH